MRLFLDQAVSTKSAPNENLGRELLELHTVGRGSHTEDDVKNVRPHPHRLEGRPMWRTSPAYGYAPEDHWTGQVTCWAGRTPTPAPDGRGGQGLPSLPRPPPGDRAPDRPQAGREVRLRRPAEALVDRLARVYLDNGTADQAGAAGARRLPGVPEPATARRSRDPGEDVVATYRLLRVRSPEADQRPGRGQRRLWQAAALGSSPFSWPRPDGQPVRQRAPGPRPSRMLASMGAHYRSCRAAGGRRRTPLPLADGLGAGSCPIRFDLLVDHLSQVMLHRARPPPCSQACCEADRHQARGSGSPRNHALLGWKMNRALLDDVPRLPRLLPPVTAMTPPRPLLRRVRRGSPAAACSPAPRPSLGTTTAFGSAVVTRLRRAATCPRRPSWSCSRCAAPPTACRSSCPHGDPVYYHARPRIAIPHERLLATDGFFGLHPELAPAAPLVERRQAGGRPRHRTPGRPTAPTSRRWRRSRTPTPAPTPAWAGSTGWSAPTASTPRCRPSTSAAGSRRARWSDRHPADTGDSVDDVRWPAPRVDQRTRPRMRSLHTAVGRQRPRPWRRRCARCSGPTPTSSRCATRPSSPPNGADYDDNDLGRALPRPRGSIRGDVGIEVLTVDHGDWDHHTDLGTLGWGRMVRQAAALGQAVAAFFTDLGTLGDNVTLVVLSEFGRRVKENANYGLDHGYGNVMFLAGAGVKGGYYGRWPGPRRRRSTPT